MIFCPKCGKQLPDEAMFCAACGAKIVFNTASELAHEPVFEPAPPAAEPAPVFEEPAPVYDEPAPVFDEPAPVYEKPASLYEEPAPVFERPAPVFEEPVPEAEEPKTYYISPLREEKSAEVQPPREVKPVPEVKPEVSEKPAEDTSAQEARPRRKRPPEPALTGSEMLSIVGFAMAFISPIPAIILSALARKKGGRKKRADTYTNLANWGLFLGIVFTTILIVAAVASFGTWKAYILDFIG